MNESSRVRLAAVPTERSPQMPWWPSAREKMVWLVLGLILVVGLYLRMGQMGLFIWGGDGGNAATAAVKLAHGIEFPMVGLYSSVGVYQGPLEIYLLSPFFGINPHPIFFARCWAIVSTIAVLVCFLVGRRCFSNRVGLLAAALFSVSFWAIAYSRHVWCQGIAHVLAVILLWCWARFLVDGKRGYLFAVVLLTLAIPQIHIAGAALAVMFIVAWLFLRFRLHPKPLIAGIGTATLFFLPYLVYQVEHNWQDFRRAADVMDSFKQEQVYSVEGIHPQYGFPLPSQNHFAQMLNVACGGQVEDFLGLSTKEFHRTPGTALAVRSIGLLRLALIGALLAVSVFLVRQARPRQVAPGVEWGNGTLLAVMFLWLVVPLAFFHLVDLRSYLSYFSFIMPVPFLLLAWAIDSGLNWAAQRRTEISRGLTQASLWTLIVVIVIGQAGYTLAYYRYLDRHGGARGTCGVMFEHQWAVSQVIAAESATPQPLIVEDWPPTKPIHTGIQYLVQLALRNRSLPAQPPLGQLPLAFVVYDTRFLVNNEMKPPLDKLPYRSYGPLRLYTIPLQIQNGGLR